MSETKKEKEKRRKLFKDKMSEVKSIWRKHRKEKGLKDIYTDHLMGEIFPVEEFHKNGPYWMSFMARASQWDRKKRSKELKEEADNLTNEKALEIQDQNRRMMIILLREALRHYQQNPSAFKKLTVSKINKLYKTVQQAEEAAKRTRIKMGKLKVEAAETFFPYQRMEVGELKKLRDSFNEGIEGLLHERTGKEDESGVISPR